MKIAVWGINYDPEPTGIGPFNTDLCVFLAERGHEVTMVSTFPYYPWWKKPPEARGKLFERSEAKGVTLHRCWHFVPAKPSTFKRVLHELSFVVTSTVRLLALPRPDVYIVVSPPLFLGIGAFLVSRIKRRPYISHVQDLQPDAALGLGMIKPGLTVKALYAIESWNYSRARLVSGISQGMLDAFSRKGVSPGKIYFFPNWIPDQPPQPCGDSVSFRGANNVSSSAPLIVYSGNVGMKQGLEVVVDAAALRDGETGGQIIHWAICGEGAAKPALASAIEISGAVGVHLYPLQPDNLYASMLREADVCLITQQRGTGQFFFPSKLLSILQFGRPVLAVADSSSELARAVAEGQFGETVVPGDAPALRAAAQRMLAADPVQRSTWASNGRKWVSQFLRSRVLTEFELILRQIAAEARPGEDRPHKKPRS